MNGVQSWDKDILKEKIMIILFLGINLTKGFGNKKNLLEEDCNITILIKQHKNHY